MRSSPRRSFPPGRQQTDVVSETPLPQPQSGPSRRRVLLVCCLIAGSGLALVIAGSFLPWVISGEVRRSSYAILGIVNRLGVAGDGALGVLIANWPLVGVLCMAPVVIACLRWWRTAGVLAVLVAMATGLLSFGILIAARSSTGLIVRLDPIGPAVMAAGAVLLLAGGLTLALGTGSPVRPR